MISTISGMEVDSIGVEPFMNGHEIGNGMSFKFEEIVITVHTSRPSQSELIHLRGVKKCTVEHDNNVLCHSFAKWAQEM